MKAIYQKPSGFSEPSHYESEVEIVGYCFGYHPDARSYNSGADTVLAVFISADGRLDFAPVRHFRSNSEPERATE